MIIHNFPGVIARVGNTVVHEQIDIELTWDFDNDPFAVSMRCSAEDMANEVTWVFGRALLAHGLESLTAVGEGDVKLRLASPNRVNLIVCLTSPDGHADLMLPVYLVERFLEDTCKVIPIGHEAVTDEQVDDFLKGVLG